MKPLFTIHAGEYVVGQFIENKYPNLNVWIPSKDTGIDLLVTNTNNSNSVSLQVKLSKDYKKFEAKSKFDQELLVTGWFTLTHEKIANSAADLWVFVLVCHERKVDPRYVVISPSDLVRHLEGVHGKLPRYHFYLSILKNGLALNSRDWKTDEKAAIFAENADYVARDLSCFRDNWASLEKLSDPNQYA